GTLVITNSGALGLGVVPVMVAANAALAIDGTTGNGPVNVTNKVLVLQYTSGGVGGGYLNNFAGAVVNLGRNNTGPLPSTNPAVRGENRLLALDLRRSSTGAGTTFIGVNAGTLDVIGPVGGMQSNSSGLGGAALAKVGAGTLRFSGAATNTAEVSAQ